jgi:hypothetical protein
VAAAATGNHQNPNNSQSTRFPREETGCFSFEGIVDRGSWMVDGGWWIAARHYNVRLEFASIA